MPDVTDNERVRLNGILAEFRQALEEEIHKVKSSGLSSTLLFAGRRIESRDTEFWYRFSVEYAPAMPADTPCKLTVGQEQFNVTVVSFDENSIIISSKIELTGALGKARLENGATVLMERLIGRIEENAEKPNPAGDRMLLQNDNKVYEPRKLFHYDMYWWRIFRQAARRHGLQGLLRRLWAGSCTRSGRRCHTTRRIWTGATRTAVPAWR